MADFWVDPWSEALASLAERCSTWGAGESDRCVLETYSLLLQGPGELCDPLVGAVSGEELSSLVKCGAPEAAAMRLLRNSGYMLSRSPDYPAIASVRLPGTARDHTFSARTEAVALCGAVATALLDTIKAALPDRLDFPLEHLQSPHTAQR